ncbi:glycoside hydrolase family 16 protein [Modestobacter sp. SYSU DS0657]
MTSPAAATQCPRRQPVTRPGRAGPRAAAAALSALLLVAGPVASVPTGAPGPGDLPGWQLVFAEEFGADVPLGGFPGRAYGDRWTGYEGFADTAGTGWYATSRVVSVADGVLDMYLRTEAGVPLVAAPVPLVGGRWGGLVHGRFSVRFRADPVPGYKTAWLLWPDSDVWAEGEVDFPEGELDGEFYAANLLVGSPGVFDLRTEGLADFADWHVATIEWAADAVTFSLDGREVASSPSSPRTPMHWVLQTETAFGEPPADAAGHVQVDWVTVHVPT